MRFLIEYLGSQEPSIVLTGEPEDFLELTAALEEKVQLAVASHHPEGPLELPGFQPQGRTRLGFGLVASPEAAQLTAKKHSCLQGILIALAGLAAFYFFCRGLPAFFH